MPPRRVEQFPLEESIDVVLMDVKGVPSEGG
jgi:hypothetical protein